MAPEDDWDADRALEMELEPRLEEQVLEQEAELAGLLGGDCRAQQGRLTLPDPLPQRLPRARPPVCDVILPPLADEPAEAELREKEPVEKAGDAERGVNAIPTAQAEGRSTGHTAADSGERHAATDRCRAN